MNGTSDPALREQLASLTLARDEPPRLVALRPIVATSVVVGLVGLAGAAWWTDAPSGGAGPTEAPPAPVVESPAGPAAVELTATGYVVAPIASSVGAPSPGRIAEVLVQRGERVRAGQALVRLDADEPTAALVQARSREQVAAARVAAARAELRHAQQRASIQRDLARRGMVAKGVADDLEAEAEGARHRLAAAKAELAAARADTSARDVALRQRTVVAPIAGTVVDEPAAPGELVGGPQSAPVVELADLERLLVEIDLAEGRLDAVRVGDPCHVIVAAYPQRRFRGRVRGFGVRVDRARAALAVHVELLDAPDDLLPGMAARVDILRRTPAP